MIPLQMKIKLIILCLTVFFLMTNNTAVEASPFERFNDIRDAWSERGITFEAAYIGEYFANTRGGLKRDDTYLGNLDLTLTFDTGAMQLWDNGTLFVYLLDNHGGQKLTGALVGDLQTVSNIEAPRTTRLYELWYEHIFLDEKLSVLIGIHDLNSEFNVTEYGGLYINSSFGIGADISGGARPSIFPLAAPAVRFKVTPNETWEILLGIYDGDPGDPEIDEHFPRSDFDAQGGALIITELAYHLPEHGAHGSLPGSFKFGFWYNTGEFADQIDTDASGNAITRDGNYGGYAVIDKMLFREDEEQGLGAFLQIGGAPDHLNEVDFYVGGGFNYKGLIPTRDEDEFGIAVAHASISDELVDAGGRNNAETTLEITYNALINDHIRVQPDVQFVYNPSADTTTPNAVVAGVRFEIAL